MCRSSCCDVLFLMISSVPNHFKWTFPHVFTCNFLAEQMLKPHTMNKMANFIVNILLFVGFNMNSRLRLLQWLLFNGPCYVFLFILFILFSSIIVLSSIPLNSNHFFSMKLIEIVEKSQFIVWFQVFQLTWFDIYRSEL